MFSHGVAEGGGAEVEAEDEAGGEVLDGESRGLDELVEDGWPARLWRGGPKGKRVGPRLASGVRRGRRLVACGSNQTKG